jgi:hypothetical protein
LILLDPFPGSEDKFMGMLLNKIVGMECFDRTLIDVEVFRAHTT